MIKKLKYDLLNFIPRKKPVGITMYHFGRVGSTVVSELLNHHPSIKWDGEIFHILKNNPEGVFDTKYEQDSLKILENRYKRTKQSVYGFEIKAIEQAHLGKSYLDMDFDAFHQRMVQMGFSRFILLKRTNIVKQLVSIQREIC